MQRMVRAAAALLAASVVTVMPSVAGAVTATGTDPTGDVSLGSTYDITELGVDLTASTVTVTVKTAAALPALTDPSWASSSNHAGRVLAVSLGEDLGHPGFLLDAEGVVAEPWAGGSDVAACSSATVNIAGDTTTLSAPAECFRYPGKVTASASLQRGLTPSVSEIDLAIAPQVTNSLSEDDLTTVDAALPGGYYQLGADGGVFAFGDAPFYGSTGSIKLNKPVVGMASQPGGGGYRFVASDGGVFSYGNAQFYGSMGGQPLNKPVVNMATTPSGNGYWLVASDGGIFAFGDAGFFGSTGSITLNLPIVGMAPTPSGNGYWLVASDGGVFSYGDAQFYGSTGAMTLNSPIIGLSPTTDGLGYVLAAEDGGVFAYGNANFYGAGASYFTDNEDHVVAVGRKSDGGYYLASAQGEVVNYGPTSDFGDVTRLGLDLNQPIVGLSINK